MNKKLLTILTLTSILSWLGFRSYTGSPANPTEIKNFHEFSIKDIDGKVLKFSSLKGKKVLLVNVASECGYTYQYEGLQKLYAANKEKLVVIGFPCNQFGGQEPGNAENIKTFCTSKYSVTFPMTEKIEVKGTGQHPIYQWLTQKALNGVEDTEVKWNFNKYLIDENGKYLHYFGSKVKPESEEIAAFLK